MIVMIALLIGVLVGIFRARQLGGGPADMAQYAAGFGLLFAAVGLIVAIAILRLT